MMVTQDRLRSDLDGHWRGGFDVPNARRRAEVVHDAVGEPEAGGGHDLFVVEALAAKARLDAVFDVAIPGERPDLSIGRNDGDSGGARLLHP